jgi:uncharacterized protein YaaR (DUF327 family)
MDKVDFSNNPAALLNSQLFGGTKTETRKSGGKMRLGKTGRTGFSGMLEESVPSGDLGPLRVLPPSEEAVQELVDAVRSAGDDLQKRPFSEELKNYKQAVRNFLHYVAENGYEMEIHNGIPNAQKPGYRGPLWDPKARDYRQYHNIRVIDRKLEELAAGILSKQISGLDLKSKVDEITGLLVDLTVTGRIKNSN